MSSLGGAVLGQAVLELVTDASKLEGGLNAAKAKTEGWAGSVGGIAKGAAIAIAGIGVAAAGILGGLSAMALGSAHAALEVNKLKRETGLSAIEASKLSYAGKRLGLDTDELSKSFGIFSKNVITSKDDLSQYHIQVVKTKDGHVDFDKTLGNVSERFKAMPDGVEKSALAMTLFGKSGKDMLPLLNQGKDGLKALGDEAQRLGLVFDDNAIGSAKRYMQAQKDIGESFDGIKNRIGMAFLPILGDLSVFLLGMVNNVFPHVVKGVETLSGWFHTLGGVIGDIAKAAQGQMSGGGDFLGSIIGPASAATFMGIVANVSLTFNHFWETVIKPALKWLDVEGRRIWDDLSGKISAAWAIIEPKLIALGEKLEGLKTKFDALPEPVKKWAQETAVTAAVIHVAGIDETVSRWLSAIGNFAGGATEATAFLLKLGTTWAGFIARIAVIGQVATAIVLLHDMVTNADSANDALNKLGLVAAAFGLGIAAVFGVLAGVVTGAFLSIIYVGSHLDELNTAWTQLSLLIKLEMAKVADAVIGAWRAVLMGINKTIADATLKVNEWIIELNKIPGVNIPLITTVQIDLPNANNVENVLNEIARNRTVRFDTYTYAHNMGLDEITGNALGTNHITRGPELLLVGEAGPEHVQVTPLAKGTGDGMNGGVTINVASLVVREDADIGRIAAELDRLQRRSSRAHGLPTPASPW